jgi:hypothetical protein
MIDVMCPRCKGSTAKGMNKPYCLHCGWNLDSAEAKARESLGQESFILVLSAGFSIYLFFAMSSTPSMAILITIFSGFLLYDVISAWKTLRDIKAIRVSKDFPASLPIAKLLSPSSDPTILRDHSQILSLPRPRSVRLSRSGKISLATTLLFCAISLGGFLVVVFGHYTGRSSWTNFGFSGLWFAFSLLFAYIGAMTISKEKRTRRLLIEGEVTLGRVTSQTLTGGRHRRSTITYVFSGGTVLERKGSGYDRNMDLYEEMVVPIFYDSRDPSQNIPECSTAWEIDGSQLLIWGK